MLPSVNSLVINKKKLIATFSILVLPGVLALGACSPVVQPSQPELTNANQQAQRSETQRSIFNELDQAVREGFVYEDYGGVNWVALSDQLRARIESGMNDQQFYAALDDLVSRLPEGMASFSTREERIATDLENTDLYEGIGAFVSFRANPEPHIVILSVMQGSPAESAGIAAHDSIYSIDSQPITQIEGLEAVNRIRGPKGSEVVLLLASPQGPRREIRVVRGQVLARDEPRGGLFDNGIYYVLVPVSANETLLNAMESALREIEAAGDIAGMIIDLRIAHSSSGWPLGELLVMFTDGELGTFFSREERSVLDLDGQDIFGSQSIPLILLIGPDTSGAPEIFASAISENNRALLVGLQTPGNSLGFSTATLTDGSQIVLANSSFENVGGQDISQSGVTPHITVLTDWDGVTATSDPVVTAAINALLLDDSP